MNDNNISAHNAEYTKKLNRLQIIKHLRRAPLSRIELAKLTGLTRAAITLITRELIEEKILFEGKGVSPGKKGKTPIPMQVNPDSNYAIGVFLNRSGCEIGICDFLDNVIEKKQLNLTSPRMLEQLKDGILEFKQKYSHKNIVGVGISAPGPLDAQEGVIFNPPGFGEWHNTAVVPYLKNTLDIPVYLENNACVLALYHLENGESRDFLLLLVDSGIGSGVVSGGNLLVSSDRYTSELGHTTIRYDGKKCDCGNYGCLEAYASIPNLLSECKGKYTSFKEIVDSDDSEILDLEADYLSAGIANIRNIISIDTVYLAGDIKYGFDKLVPRIMSRVSMRSIVKKPLSILPSFHISDMGVCAAANLVFTKWLYN